MSAARTRFLPLAQTCLCLGTALLVSLAACTGGSSKPANSGTRRPKASSPSSTTPTNTAPKPATSIQGSGTPGKTPDRPAPEVTAEMLAEWDRLYIQAKEEFNNYQRKHLKGEDGDMVHAGKAKELVDQIFASMDEALIWEEEATMEDWAKPAGIEAMLKRFKKYSTLEKKIRMTGI